MEEIVINEYVRVVWFKIIPLKDYLLRLNFEIHIIKFVNYIYKRHKFIISDQLLICFLFS